MVSGWDSGTFFFFFFWLLWPWVQSLVRELRSHKLHSSEKKKKKNPKPKTKKGWLRSRRQTGSGRAPCSCCLNGSGFLPLGTWEKALGEPRPNPPLVLLCRAGVGCGPQESHPEWTGCDLGKERGTQSGL